MTGPSFRPRNPIRLAAVAGAVLAGVALCGLALITIGDVIMRAFGFNLFTGMVEVSSLTVLCLGFFALPYCFMVSGHIVVDIATASAPERFNRRLDGLWNLVAAAFLAAAAVFVMQSGLGLEAAGERSATMQWSPLVFHVPAVIGMAVAALTCVVLGMRDLFGAAGKSGNQS